MSIPGSSSALFLAAAAAGAGGYQVERSLRFNSSDSAYLSRTPASAGNRKTFTLSSWVKMNPQTIEYARLLESFSSYASNRGGFLIYANTLSFYNYTSGTVDTELYTAQVFRDYSAWYHIVLAVDTTQASSSNRFKLYVNGAQVSFTGTVPAQNTDMQVNAGQLHNLCALAPGSGYGYYFNGYLADVHFIDGQALNPSSFVETSATTGRLEPKQYAGSFGTNGFWLPFSDTSSTTSGSNAGIGKDFSGNGNYWNSNNLSVTAGSGLDLLVDTPTSYGTGTSGGDVRGNFATLNPLNKGAATLTNGNLDWASGGANSICQSTIAMSSGKWFCEFTALSTGCIFGLQRSAGTLPTNYLGQAADGWGYVSADGKTYNNGASATYGATFTTNDVIGVAFDADNGTLSFYKNGTSQGQAYSGLTNGPYTFAVGSDGTISATVNFGQRAFAYTPPPNYKPLVDTYLPSPVVAKPSTVMDVALYSGNSSTQSISGYNLSPDLVWIKTRGPVANNNFLFDAVRGATKYLMSDLTSAEQTVANTLTSFDSGGFTTGSNNDTNASGRTFVAWMWDAGSSTVTNTQGSITSSVRANTSAGFSIVTFTSNASGNATVGHGLGVAPSLVILKNRTGGAGNWLVFHKAVCTKDNFLYLNSTNALGTYTDVQGAAIPSSTVFGINAGIGIAGSADCVAYVFSPVAGYSSFGSYVGNGSTDGPFVYTGHRVRWLLVKNATNGGSWVLHDTARSTYNVSGQELLPDSSGAEYTFTRFDFLSNGFKGRSTNNASNTNGDTYIYAAFAENPFQYARAR